MIHSDVIESDTDDLEIYAIRDTEKKVQKGSKLKKIKKRKKR